MLPVRCSFKSHDLPPHWTSVEFSYQVLLKLEYIYDSIYIYGIYILYIYSIYI